MAGHPRTPTGENFAVAFTAPPAPSGREFHGGSGNATEQSSGHVIAFDAIGHRWTAGVATATGTEETPAG
ncbi:hypothetical protein AB0I28_29685 [Phytomonospora sp. NPDC050363]|uniref:hypothetical protein n=1 Tax=Phytomonospora sp. NPDC050363 TaxID=3155642 RepID=UPI0033D9FA5C